MVTKKLIKKYDCDVAIVGAGPAGLMAAGKAASLGLKVILIEKNSAPAKKLLLTGNGRCNLTNLEPNLKELVKNYNNGEFLFHAFSAFGPKETIGFFEDLGVKIKVEKNKRVFPKSDDAEDVLEALIKYLSKKKVEILFNSEVTDIEKKGNPPSTKATARQGKVAKLILKNREIVAKNYIICTGGKSYPLTGSDGLGYELAKKLGHTIVKPIPALSPIELKDGWMKDVQGISLEDVRMDAFQAGKKQFSQEGQILFTHFGLSGPAILDISGKVGNLLEKGETKISLDLFPLLNQEELEKGLEDILKRNLKKTIRNILSEFVPERLADALLSITKIDGNKIANNMSKTERAIIIKELKNIEVTPKNLYALDQAMVTRGGISLKEIDHKTMKSRIIDNLSFAGEIMDVDGKTGGFNLQMCWSTGFIAGENCK